MIKLALDFINDRVPDTIAFLVLMTAMIVGAIWMLYKCVASVITLNVSKSNKDGNSEINDEEPPLTEIKVKLVTKECFVKTYGIKYPETRQEFYFAFETDDKKILRYKVEESEYHSYDENQNGTIAIVNDNYYGFCPDE